MPICKRIFNSCSIVHSCALSLLKSTLVKYTSFQRSLQYDKQKHTLECSPHGLSACSWERVNTYKNAYHPVPILLGTTIMYLIVKLGGWVHESLELATLTVLPCCPFIAGYLASRTKSASLSLRLLTGYQLMDGFQLNSWQHLNADNTWLVEIADDNMP